LVQNRAFICAEASPALAKTMADYQSGGKCNGMGTKEWLVTRT